MDKSKLQVIYEISPELLRRHLNACRLLPGEKIYDMDHKIAVDFYSQSLGKLIANRKNRLVAVSDGREVLGLAIARHKKAESEILKTEIVSVDWLSIADGLLEDIRMDASLILIKRMDSMLRQEFNLITLLADVDNTGLTWVLQNNGYQIYATNTTHTFNLRKMPDFQMSDALLMRFMRPSEVSAVMASASAAFSDYRSHYHFDPKLFPGPCTETYIKFVQRSIEAGDPIALAVLKNSPDIIFGFLTFNWYSEVNEFFGRKRIGEIEIGGVIPDGRGKGVYDTMMKFGVNWYADNGADLLVVNANIGNIATQRCWAKMGFSLRRYQYRFHKWSA